MPRLAVQRELEKIPTRYLSDTDAARITKEVEKAARMMQAARERDAFGDAVDSPWIIVASWYASPLGASGTAYYALCTRSTNCILSRLILPLLGVVAATMLLPLLPPHNGLSLSQAPLLLHAAFSAAAATAYLYPWLCILADTVAQNAWRRAAAFALPIAPAIGVALLACFFFMGLRLWRAPWNSLFVLHGLTLTIYAALPVAMWNMRRVKSLWPAPGATTRAAVLGVACTALFLLTASIFLVLFAAAGASTALQLVAIILFQFVGHILFKGFLLSVAVKALPTDRHLRAHHALASAIDVTTQLFIAFSHTVADNAGVLVVTVAINTLFFVANGRHFFLHWMQFEHRIVKVLLPSTKKASIDSARAMPPSSEADSHRERSSSISFPDDSSVSEAFERVALELGGTELLSMRRATGFGVFFLIEVFASIAFATALAAMCFGPNARFFGFGTSPTGTCSSGDFLVPILVCAGSILLHTLLYIAIHRHIMSLCSLNVWVLSWRWIRANHVFIGMVVAAMLSKLAELALSQYVGL